MQRFYRYHEQIYQKSVSENKKSVIYVLSYWNIFKKCLPQLVNIFLVFFVTLSLFPAVLSGNVSTLLKQNLYWNFKTILDIDRVHPNFFISAEYFISLTCFLTFNLAAVLGNILSSYVTWVRLENTDHQTCQLTVKIYHEATP